MYIGSSCAQGGVVEQHAQTRLDSAAENCPKLHVLKMRCVMLSFAACGGSYKYP